VPSHLREYKAEKKSLFLHLGRLSKPDDLVFASIEGKRIEHGVLNHNFARIAKRAGLHDVRFHDLRHTFASLMLLRGAKPEVISEALGRSSVALTMDDP
jgi:integrase